MGVLGGPGHCPELSSGPPQRPSVDAVPAAQPLADRHLTGNWPETEQTEVRASYPQVHVESQPWCSCGKLQQPCSQFVHAPQRCVW